MDRLPTTDVPGWLHTSLQGEVITPAPEPINGLLPDTQTPVVAPLVNNFAHDPSQTELFRVSKGHGRSFELGPNANRNLQRLGRVALWQDEYDNSYTSYSLKGNDFTYSTIMESLTAPSGYIPMGLLESDALLRVVRSSRLLREAGIATEWIHRVFEPQQLMYKGELVSQEEYKRRLLIDAANERGLEEMAKIAAAIEPMTFFITGRSMEINDRLADFNHDTPETARKRLQRIFAVYNATHSEDDEFKRLQPARQTDRDRFFKTIFPTLLGKNLAKLHNANMVHTFPTLSNVTILGGIIDLDSIKGAPLAMDDTPVTAGDRANDIANITDYDDTSLDLRQLYLKLDRLGITSKPYHSVDAQLALVDTYSETRTPHPRKQDRQIESIAINGANWHFNGTNAMGTYMQLSKRESRKAIKNIWMALSDLADEVWSDDGMAKEARDAIDVQLKHITDELLSNEELTLTKELLEPARKYFRLSASDLFIGVRNQFPELVEKIDEAIDLPKLRQFIPNKDARHRVLKAIMLTASLRVSKLATEDIGEAELQQQVADVIDKEIDAFLEKVTPADWEVLAHTLDNFTIVDGKPASDVMIYEQKAAYAFEEVDLAALITSAGQAGIPIITPEVIRPFNRANYFFPPEGLRVRTTFSDGAGYKLTRLTIVESKRETVAAMCEGTMKKAPTYMALLCEDEENGGYVLYVDCDDKSA